MASQYPPKKNTAFTLYFTLYKNDGTVVANPGTITKKVSIDGAAVADIAAAVTEEDTTYGQCSVVLAAGEMNGDAIWIYITDNTAGTVPFTCTLYTAANTQDAIEAKIDIIQADTDLLDDAAGGLADIHTDIAAVKSDTAAILLDTGTDGVIVASLATQAKADVNAEVLDVLNTDTFAEPGQGAPGATITLAAKIGYLYKAFRNRITQTATEMTIYNDDGTTAGQKSTVSDDGSTYTRGELGTGA